MEKKDDILIKLVNSNQLCKRVITKLDLEIKCHARKFPSMPLAPKTLFYSVISLPSKTGCKNIPVLQQFQAEQNYHYYGK